MTKTMKDYMKKQSSRATIRILISLIITLCLTQSLYAQIGVTPPYKLGSKSSAYYSGLDHKGVGLAIGTFLQVGGGWEDNIYRSPYIFSWQTKGATSPARVYGSEVNIPRGDIPLITKFGVELGSTFGESQRLRLLTLGQFKRFEDEFLGNRSAFSGLLSYRNDLTNILRFDIDTDYDVQRGPTTLIFGVEDVSNETDVTRLRSQAVLSIESVRFPFIGRGVSQIAAMARFYDYGPANHLATFINGNDTTNLANLNSSGLSMNDTLEADYFQLRGRLRHTQGLYRGYSARVTFDYMKRTYLHQWAKMIATDSSAGMGYIPDSLNSNPDTDYPHRSQHEYRLYAGVRYDPPHINNARINLGLQGLWVKDPFEGFYGYNQYSLFGSAMYTPKEKSFIEFVFGIKNRAYDELLANYEYWWAQDTSSWTFRNISRDRGEALERTDLSWWQTKLKKVIVEFSLRGQAPLHHSVALWGNYSLDMEHTNRPTGEFLSRSYTSQMIAGGLTFFLDVLGPEPHYLFSKNNDQ